MSRALLLAALLVLAMPTTAAGTSAYSAWPANYRFVAFNVPAVEHPVAGRLSFPAEGAPPWPAVIIAHGSGGVDARGPLYARHLNQAGIAALEIDMWSARGLNGGLDRPEHVRETLPDAFAARAFLRQRDDIDGNHVGLMGFSWGGVMAMLTAGGATPGLAGGKASAPFEALVALYPVCWGYNQVEGYELERITAAELLVITGTQDDYDARDDCQRLLGSLPENDRRKAELVLLSEATHAFDYRAPATVFTDPYARRGQGGEVRIRYNPAATKHALSKVTEFFRMALISSSRHQPVATGKPGQRTNGRLPPVTQ